MQVTFHFIEETVLIEGLFSIHFYDVPSCVRVAEETSVVSRKYEFVFDLLLWHTILDSEELERTMRIISPFW